MCSREPSDIERLGKQMNKQEAQAVVMTNTQRAAELHALFDNMLTRGERPTWITGRDVHGEACVRLTWADVELLRARCRRPWYRRALTAINKWLCDT